MKSEIDCRKKENEKLLKCKTNKFCNKEESNLYSAGKGIISLTLPTAGVAIATYHIGKSLIKLGICKK